MNLDQWASVVTIPTGMVTPLSPPSIPALPPAVGVLSVAGVAAWLGWQAGPWLNEKFDGIVEGTADIPEKVGVDSEVLRGPGVLNAKESKKSGKERGSDIPEWAAGNKPLAGEKPTSFAKRILDEKYGAGKWKEGPNTEYNKLKKYAERNRR